MAVVQPLAIFDEVLEFLASMPTPEQIITFRPSSIMQARLHYLLDANRNGTLSIEENKELDVFVRLEHFMRMLKIKAHQKLTQS